MSKIGSVRHRVLDPRHCTIADADRLRDLLDPLPVARRARMAASTLAPVLGRPRRTPRALARSRPALTRLRIIALSNSAKAPVTWKNIRPAGVVVSIACWCRTNAAPAASNSPRVSSRSTSEPPCACAGCRGAAGPVSGRGEPRPGIQHDATAACGPDGAAGDASATGPRRQRQRPGMSMAARWSRLSDPPVPPGAPHEPDPDPDAPPPIQEPPPPIPVPPDPSEPPLRVARGAAWLSAA
jgi:hypothetical protein